MALNPKFSATLANAAFDAGGMTALFASGKVKFYDGTQPADTTVAISTQNLLATLTLNATAFGAASAGVATAGAITGANAVFTGTATWARIQKSDGTTNLIDCTVGTSGCDINMNTTAFVNGVAVNMTALTITLPEP